MKTEITLLLGCLTAAFWPSQCLSQADPFEPDNAFPFLGASMDGGVPGFTVPFDNLIDRIEGWQISGRTLTGTQDLDWFVFNGEDYPYCLGPSEIRVIAGDNFTQANLRLEVLSYSKDLPLNPSSTGTSLQSCAESPVGSSTVPVAFEDLGTFYRLRSCTNAGTLKYRFEFRILYPGFCFAPSNITGTVRDVRNGRISKGAYVYTNRNRVTFSSPQDGEFNFLVIQDNNVVIDFLAGDLESLGPTVVGSVVESDTVDNVILYGQPPGMIFFSGFE